MEKIQELEFEIAEVLLSKKDTKLFEIEEKFFNKFEEVFQILVKQNLGAFEFEGLLYDYLDILKKEYYFVNRKKKEIIDNDTLKEIVLEVIM